MGSAAGAPIEYGLGLGSNEGDRRVHLRAGLRALATAPETRVVAVSGLYETEPLDVPPAAAGQLFYNAVAIVESGLDPWAMLALAARIEAAAGRLPPEARGRNEPRPLDLDILYAGAWSSRDARLLVPHPRMGERRFVLAPLAELRAELRPPGWTCTVAKRLSHLDRVGRAGAVRRIGPLDGWGGADE